MIYDRSDERKQPEPIAIVGIGCRFPGGVDSPDRFWELLRDGVDAIDEFPAGRFDIDDFYSPTPATPGKIVTRQGGFLRDIDRFDADFFGISPREAMSMDPQQRLLLETAWEALEDAGLVQERLAGSRTGVYIGLWLNDYEASLYAESDEVELYTTTGGGRYPAAGRISFALDLRGPSLTVDTACSSSLVAIHLAVQGLRSGETVLALAGGVNVILQPQISLAYSRSGMLAPDGRCKFGDAQADGYVRSDGCGVVALKRLADALAVGDSIYAVIRGSAVNNDGQGSGFLVQPSVDGQAAMLRAAYADAGVDPGAVRFVEAHGTGTLAGDPVELQAIGAVLSEGRPPGSPCLVGSVKTNMGHTEGAAGVAGLIKAALALKHGSIPSNLHFAVPSPRIPWDQLPVVIPTELTPWPTDDMPRYAGVNSFGITGTNAHIVLEAAPNRPAPERTERASDLPVLLPISARSEPALRALAASYAAHVRGARAPALADVAFTAATRRSHLPERLAVVAGSRESLGERLAAFAAGRPAPGISRASAADCPPRLVFVFPGQGGQWIGMGQRLFATESVFATALARCSAEIESETGWSLLEELQATPEYSRLGEIDVVQPAIFAIQVALATLLEDWGLRPDVVVGHSMGEAGAAHVAGILSLEDATAVICRRSRLLKRVAGRGAMGLVELSLAEAEALVEHYGDCLAVAASNGPTTSVLSGDAGALDDVLAIVQARGGFARRVQVDVASHSPQMEPLLPELDALLAELDPGAARIGFASTVTGSFLAGPELGASYWTRNLRQPVLFGPVIAELLRGGETAFLELSPHPVLQGSVEGAARAGNNAAVVAGALRREQDEAETLREAVGALWAAGTPVAWERVGPGRVALPLPGNPWQRERFWFTSARRTTRRQAAESACDSAAGSLLGAALPDLAVLPGSRVWQGRVEASDGSAGATVCDVPIVPGAAAALIATAAVTMASGAAVERLVIAAQPFLTTALETQTVLTPLSDHAELRLFTRPSRDEPWSLWATARTAATGSPSPPMDVESLQARLARYPWDGEGIVEVWSGASESLARLEPAGEGDLGRAELLTAASQLLCESLDDPRTLLVSADMVTLPAAINDAVWVHALRRDGADSTGDLSFLTGDGAVLAELKGVHLRAPDDELLRQASIARIEDCLYAVEWRVDQGLEPRTPVAGNWLILADANGFGERLAASFVGRGVCAVVLNASANNPEAFDELFRESQGAKHPGYTGVIDLRALDETDVELPVAVERCCGQALILAQSLARIGWETAPRLWLVTRGSQPADGPPRNPAGAALWGLGRVIANEHPEFWGGLVDLDPAPSMDDTEALCAAVLSPRGEDEIALRGDRRLVTRLARRHGLCKQPVQLHPDATYLITGGTGGVGLIVARWMISSGARHLVLVGRRPLDATSNAALSELESTGARVTYLRGDVANYADISAIFDTLSGDFPPLRGIVHSAAMTVDATLPRQTVAGFSAVLGPKVIGAWNLAAASRGRPLDFLALFSSVGALLGMPGLANYVAANATLDALAHSLRAAGVPATSIGWGHWRDTGLAATADRGASYERRGLSAMPAEVGVAALGRVLAMDAPHLIVATMDWATYLGQGTANAPRFTDLAAETTDDSGVSSSDARFELRRRLEGAEAGDRGDLMLEGVRAYAAVVLRFDDPHSIPPRQGFSRMGMDSLRAVELKNWLQHVLGLSLPATLAFDYPTPVALAQYLLGALFPATPALHPSGEADDEILNVLDLSRDELRELMNAELQLIDKELG